MKEKKTNIETGNSSFSLNCFDEFIITSTNTAVQKVEFISNFMFSCEFRVRMLTIDII